MPVRSKSTNCDRVSAWKCGENREREMGGKTEKCKEGCVWTWSSFITAVFEYDTAKIVHIKNKKVGLMNRLVQLGIVGYIIG